VDDLNFRAEFRRALDPIAQPAPWLAASVRDGLRERRHQREERRRILRSLDQPAWLLPVVAALLIIAILLAILAGAHLLNNHAVPVKVPQLGVSAPAGCPTWSSSPQSPAIGSDRMVTPSTGWARGALRTTDSGAQWTSTAPDAMLSDAPAGTDAALYPPGYTDFFLDANHAWMAYGLPSKTSCFDHVTLLSTADGGRSWKRSQAVDAAIQADTMLQLQLFFLDAQHGWLMVLASGRLAPDWFLYSTSNGGRDWQLVSQIPLMGSWCTFEFVTLEVGFLGDCANGGGPSPTLVETRDGGITWSTIVLPIVRGNGFETLAPVFFDPEHAVVHVLATITQGNTMSPDDYFAATDDGGQTWYGLPAPSFPGFPQAVGFADRQHFVALTADGKGSVAVIYVSADGGRTWTATKGVLSAMEQSYPEIEFVDAEHGFVDEPSAKIGGAPAAFLITNDGGRTWTDAHPKKS